MGLETCDGQGLCGSNKPTTNCVPYTCDPVAGACRDHCASDDDCTGGRACLAGSCSAPAPGVSCTRAADCASGFCVDGLCCNVACAGACVSCGLPGREGTCWPIEDGQPDPSRECVDEGPASCGQNGLCNGFGACSRYPASTGCPN